MLGLRKRLGFARSGRLGALVARGRHYRPDIEYAECSREIVCCEERDVPVLSSRSRHQSYADSRPSDLQAADLSERCRLSARPETRSVQANRTRPGARLRTRVCTRVWYKIIIIIASCARGDTTCLRPLQVDNIFAFIRQVAPVSACWVVKTSATS